VKPHELSKLFPPMSEQELKQLAADIKRNGLRSPIVCHEGAILDGVQREKACKIVREPPDYVDFKDMSPALWRNGPLAFVVSENLHRRHLSPETSRELHRKLVPLVVQHIKDEQEKNISARLQKKSRGRPKESGVKDKAVKQVAEMTGCSERTVYSNIRNGSTERHSRSLPPLKLSNTISTLIERARTSKNQMVTIRFGDYLVMARYRPDRKFILPAVKRLTNISRSCAE
jgi:hypothetical protein